MLNRGAAVCFCGVIFFSCFVVPFSLRAAEIARTSIPDPPSVSADQSLVFERDGRSALVLLPSDDPVLRLVEIGGKEVVLRLVPMDPDGNDLESGRVIVLGPQEQRDVRLRDVLSLESLAGVQLRAEVRRGEGRVTVSNLGANGLRAQADNVPRRRAVRNVPLPTSFTLIDQAEAAGTLDSETAMIYRVFVLFDDARLPVRYQGDDSRFENDRYMGQVLNRFTTLSEAAQAILLPYLIPPAYVGSWANVNQSMVDIPNLLPCLILAINTWGFVDSSNGEVRVWYRLPIESELVRARNIVSEVDSTIWPKLSTLMSSRQPVDDRNELCGGGDRRLDIYLVDVKNALAFSFLHCKPGRPAPGFILMSRNHSDAVLVHEIFHVLQDAYPVAGCHAEPEDAYRWWGEASATWAMDFVYPANDAHWGAEGRHSHASTLLNVPEISLHLKQEPHWYSAYLLPFFLHRIKSWDAGFVRGSWEKSATMPAIKALNESLPEKLTEVWPEFAKANWNRPPADNYSKMQVPMTHKAYGENAPFQDVIPSVPEGEINLPVSYELPPLSATYKHFKFDTTDTASFVNFLNGATWKLSLENDPFLGPRYSLDPANEDQIKGGRIKALIKIRGENWKEADWTGERGVSYCRDMLDQRIDELVLIISNSEFEQEDRKLKPPDLDPLLWASNIGCAKWKGEVTYTHPGFGLTVKTNVEWKLNKTTLTWEPSGKGSYTFSAPCRGGGSFDVDPAFTPLSLNFGPQLTDANRSYRASGGVNQTIDFDCQDVPHRWPGLPWLEMPARPTTPGLPGQKYLRVDESGSIMEGKHETGFGVGWSWKFVAVKE